MIRCDVLIPCYNDAERLERALSALLDDGARPDEICVIDDGSTDQTSSVARDLGVRLLHTERNAGPSAARNLGAAESDADILWFLDSDVVIRPGSREQVINFFERHPEANAVIGSYDDSPSHDNVCSQFKNLFHHYVHQHAGPFISSFWAGCGAIRREVFLQAGGFDEDRYRRPMICDIELGYRLTSAGERIHVLPSLQARHYKRWTLWSLIRTDVFSRAVPWTMLLLRKAHGKAGGELNLAHSQKVSVVLVHLAALLLLISPLAPVLLIPAVLGLGLVIGVNGDLVLFFAGKRGRGFLLFAIPLLWLYYFYCGVGFAIGFAGHVLGIIRDVILSRPSAPRKVRESDRRDVRVR